MIDPAVFYPTIAEIHGRGEVLDGLVGGWLPVVRFATGPPRAGIDEYLP